VKTVNQAPTPKPLFQASEQDQLVKKLIYFSIAAHLGVMVLQSVQWFWSVPEFPNEWAIDATLVADFDVGAPDKTVIPDAKKDEQAAAPKDMLPQLTKRFSVDEAAAADDAGEVPSDLQKSDKANESKEKEKLKIVEQADANKIKMQDALKRLALEKLRKQNESDTAKTEKVDGLARIKEQLASNEKVNAGAVGGMSGEVQRYRALLQQAVRRHYALPEAYNLKDANLVVVISVVINERGELMKQDVYKSSGDSVFDELALTAIKSAVPLPPPPRAQAGEMIHLQFTPKSF
jgi:TolA protein